MQKITASVFDFSVIRKAVNIKSDFSPEKGEGLADAVNRLLAPSAKSIEKEHEKLNTACAAILPDFEMRYPRRLLAMAKEGRYPELGVPAILTLDQAAGFIDRAKEKNRSLRYAAYTDKIEPLAKKLATDLSLVWEGLADQALRAEAGFYAEFGISGSTTLSQSILDQLRRCEALRNDLNSDNQSCRSNAVRALRNLF